MKSYVAIILLIVAILGIIGLAVVSERATPPAKKSQTVRTRSITLQGIITDIAANRSQITIRSGNGEELDVTLTPTVTIFDTQKQPLPLSALHRGFSVQITGMTTKDATVEAASITTTKMPNIILYEPATGSTITNVFTLSGIARVFENVVSLRVKNMRTNKILLTGTLEAKPPDTGQYGSFKKELTLSPTNLKRGDVLEISLYQSSAKDGSEIDTVKSSVTYDTVKHLSIKVFFPNDNLNTSDMCNKVYSVERNIPATTAVAQAAVTQLLQGPTDGEVIEGYGTALNDDLSLKSVIIKNSTAYVDFGPALQKNLNGTCRIDALTAQITQTLKQFTTITSVSILIDGQPITLPTR